MIGIYPNGTLTIDTISEPGSWDAMLRLDHRNQDMRDKQTPRLRVEPIEFIGKLHRGGE